MSLCLEFYRRIVFKILMPTQNNNWQKSTVSKNDTTHCSRRSTWIVFRPILKAWYQELLTEVEANLHKDEGCSDSSPRVSNSKPRIVFRALETKMSFMFVDTQKGFTSKSKSASQETCKMHDHWTIPSSNQYNHKNNFFEKENMKILNEQLYNWELTLSFSTALNCHAHRK